MTKGHQVSQDNLRLQNVSDPITVWVIHETTPVKGLLQRGGPNFAPRLS